MGNYQVAAVVKRAFADWSDVLIVCIPGPRGSPLDIHALDHCNTLYMELLLEDHSEATADPECSGMGSDGYVIAYTHIWLFWELPQLPVGFWVQFKVLVITYKALHGVWPDYLKENLFLYVWWSQLQWACSGFPLMEKCHLVWSRKHASLWWLQPCGMTFTQKSVLLPIFRMFT